MTFFSTCLFTCFTVDGLFLIAFMRSVVLFAFFPIFNQCVIPNADEFFLKDIKNTINLGKAIKEDKNVMYICRGGLEKWF